MPLAYRYAGLSILAILAVSAIGLLHRELAGVEVKAGATVTQSDFRGLRKLKRIVGQGFGAGVVLYDGQLTAGYGDGMFAVPIRCLLEGRSVEPGTFGSGLG